VITNFNIQHPRVLFQSKIYASIATSTSIDYYNGKYNNVSYSHMKFYIILKLYIILIGMGNIVLKNIIAKLDNEHKKILFWK
jgi:hypothetical protein